MSIGGVPATSGTAELAVSEYVGRVYQTDAGALDREVISILRDQLKTACSYLPINLFTTVEPEVMAILKYIIWKYTIGGASDSVGTVGQTLLGIGYRRPSSAQLRGHLLITVVLHWLRRRLSTLVELATYTQQTRDKVHGWANTLDTVVRIMSLVNTLLFLRGGVYVTLCERILGLQQHRIVSSSAAHTINYTYITREALWRGFSDFLMCVLPLVDPRRLRGLLVSVLRRFRPTHTAPPSSSAVLTPHTRCPWCQQSPCLPHQLCCAHLCCYYCVTESISGCDIDGAVCPQCGVLTDRSLIRPLPMVK